MGERKILWRMISLSILAHLALIFLLPGLQEIQRPAEQRIKLTLASRNRVLAQPPESARVPEPPPDAVNPASWNAQAQNPEPTPEVDGRPRSIGDIEMFDFRRTDLLAETTRQRSSGERSLSRERTPEPSGEPTPEESGLDAQARGSVALKQPRETDDRDRRESSAVRPTGASAGEAEEARRSGRPRPRHHSPRSAAATAGELSLSTYEWAWAPYLEYLKETISDHWHPPLAFYMGLVEGDGVIRFRIHPDGAAARIQVLDEYGHPSLARAARNAVDYAGPFRPLPDGFTDPHLDVTWQYRYIVRAAAGSD
jgi:outer membrane biosynthesis protein TonB